MKERRTVKAPPGWSFVGPRTIKSETTGCKITKIPGENGPRYEAWPRRSSGRYQWPDYHRHIGIFDNLQDAIRACDDWTETK